MTFTLLFFFLTTLLIEVSNGKGILAGCVFSEVEVVSVMNVGAKSSRL